MTKRKMNERRIGFHTSIEGGIHLAIERARMLGCNTVQVFSHNPRAWRVKEPEKEEIQKLSLLRKLYDINPLFVHASYLINLASSRRDVYSKSTELLLKEVEISEMIGADYLVIHTGSSTDSDRKEAMNKIVMAMKIVAKRSKGKSCILLENTAGERGHLTSRIEDLARIMDEVNSDIIKGICIDTCHAFQAGYNIKEDEGIEELLREIEKFTGIERVKLIHLNDSKREFNTGVDRHEHIGMGFIGKQGFKRFLNHPAFTGIPLILETPKKSDDDDIKNLMVLKELLT